MTKSENESGFISHLTELRKRLINTFIFLSIIFVICYIFAEHIYGFLVDPYASAVNDDGQSRRLIFTALQETFLTYLKVSFFVAFFILFFLGGALVYYLIMPLAINFFLSFESSGVVTQLPIQLEAKVNEYLSLIMKLIFAFGLSFQLPVILSLLARINVIDSTYLKERRKYVVVIIFAFAALLTPPDPITQIGLAIPLLILYEFSIISVSIIEKRNSVKEDA